MVEKKTDLWVWDLIKDAGLDKYLEPERSSIVEIDEALAKASKAGTGYRGRPEFVGVVNGEYVIVIEDKRDTDKHEAIDKETDLLKADVESVRDYAVNGAVWYGKFIAEETSFNKVFAIGVSGNEKHHKITPYFVNERGGWEPLDNVNTFVQFSPENIDVYYLREVLKEDTDKEKEEAMILKDAKRLHEALRTYGAIQDKDKPLVVSGILLALSEIEKGTFSVESLTGDSQKTDGEKVHEAIDTALRRSNVSPETKRDKILSQFRLFINDVNLNQVVNSLQKTPIKHYTEFINEHIYENIRYTQSSEDILGRFYGEFMSYSGGDGQTLGIVLTPRHITDLFSDLLGLNPDDKVIDPTCGTGGFLISAMHNMLEQVPEDDETKRNEIKRDQLFGIEKQAYMFTISTTNMILRGDGKSNLQNKDFLRVNPNQLQLEGFTVGMINPPYSQGTASDPEQHEIYFLKHLLDSMAPGGRVAMIAPQSSMTGKSKAERKYKEQIMENHTLEGVITLNKDTFYQVGTNPCISIFKAHEPHAENKLAKFINFEDDGYIVKKHVGLYETPSAVDRKEHLLQVWNDEVEYGNDFCVETTVSHDDEWLHSYFYFNDTIPEESEFQKTMADYLTFELDMVLHDRSYLFMNDDIEESDVEIVELMGVEGAISETVIREEGVADDD